MIFIQAKLYYKAFSFQSLLVKIMPPCEIDIENRLMEMGRGEERVRCMERVTRKFNITVCKIDSKQEFVVWLRKLKQRLCVNLEWWDGEGDGREVQKGGGKCIPMADSC